MKRREFIARLGGRGGVAASGARAAADDAGDRVSRRQITRDVEYGPSVWISPGPSETGYIEGENVAVKYRWAEGRYDRLPALAAELVRRNARDRASG